VSHLVTIRTRMRDPAVLAAACRRLGLAEPAAGEFLRTDYDAEPDPQTGLHPRVAVSGLLVRLPGWSLPVAVQADGTAVYDNYGGCWGEQAQLDRLLQAYAVEAVRAQAARSGRTVREEPLEDGSVKLTLQEA